MENFEDILSKLGKSALNHKQQSFTIGNINPLRNLEDANKKMETLSAQIANDKRRDREIQEAIASSLKQIEKNTANLAEIMFLIKEGNIAREEIYYLITEMMKISLANNTEEAESKFREVLNKANDMKAGAELITYLVTVGKSMIDFFK